MKKLIRFKTQHHDRLLHPSFQLFVFMPLELLITRLVQLKLILGILQ